MPDGVIVDGRKVSDVPPDERSSSICTGSQGEPMAALSRIANATTRSVRIEPGDTVVLASAR